ncbi:hypothetical protein A6V39_00745 [Candidatus Mycoplasma haematobovis]|uniref:Uncharacterized protein n=1 Tax=Candidatus Mycoplasma haematobovis TaxID=432608 RepID=A0A1A9QFT8_9MOLU|nr:hypothetical protein [Candidatus Mycoplasma haematobovis]OAL10579.1 hypothetical protein A6V39_00745 [Candidatus Mycoplasma haematobovis]
MTQAGKAVALVSALGAVGGGVAVASGAFNQSEKQQPQQKTEDVITISSKLASEGFDTNVTDTEWEALLNAHNAVQDGNIFEATSSEQKDKAWLTKKCRGALGKGEEDSANYLLARQWCVKETSISTLFGKEGSKHKLLSTDERNTETNQSEWTQKINSLKTNDSEKQKLKVKLDKGDAENIVEIKKVCATIVATKTTVKEFNEKLELAKNWCSA